MPLFEGREWSLMRVCVTERTAPSRADLRSLSELAPSLALPWVVRLRYCILAGLTTLVAVARFGLGIQLQTGWVFILLGLGVASNLFARRFARAVGDHPALGCLLAADIAGLTAFLALTGGASNPLSLFYLVEITLSAVVLSREWTWLLGALSVAGFAFLFWLHVPLAVFERHHTPGMSLHLAGMWIAFVAAALLVTISIGKVSSDLRSREQEVLQLQDQLARQDRLASIATLAAAAAHELGTPLATIAVVSRDLELRAKESAANPDLANDAQLLRSEVERCRSILRRMNSQGAGQEGESLSRVDLNHLLQDVRREFGPSDQERIQLHAEGGPGTVPLPVAAARQALKALVRNGLDASGEAQPVRLGVVRDVDSLGFVVEDSGCGMGPETLNRITEPFFTTKAASGGLGLGTYLVRAFAEQLGGRLTFDSERGKGTRVMLELPVTENGQ